MAKVPYWPKYDVIDTDYSNGKMTIEVTARDSNTDEVHTAKATVEQKLGETLTQLERETLRIAVRNLRSEIE